MQSLITLRLSKSIEDIADGVSHWRLWTQLAWTDVRRQYRRSFLGPLWITFSLAIFIAAYGYIGSLIFNVNAREYLPYLAVGHVIFTLINFLIIDSCTSYIASENLLKQLPISKIVPVLRTQLRNWIVFGHHIAVPAFVLLLFDVKISGVAILSLVGLILVVFFGLGMGLLLAALCARYRDVPLIVNNLMQILFFVTPVLWYEKQVGESGYLLVKMNPIAALIKTVRDPLLGVAPSVEVWFTASACAVSCLFFGFIAFTAVRHRIVYWL